MKRMSLFMAEDLMARLEVESKRTNTPVSELIRQAVSAFVPPISVRKPQGFLVPQTGSPGYLEVSVLQVKDGKMQVEPKDSGGWQTVLWVDARLVHFDGVSSGLNLVQEPGLLRTPPMAPTSAGFRMLHQDVPISPESFIELGRMCQSAEIPNVSMEVPETESEPKDKPQGTDESKEKK
jgi:hypothetical protein